MDNGVRIMTEADLEMLRRQRKDAHARNVSKAVGYLHKHALGALYTSTDKLGTASGVGFYCEDTKK